MPLAGLTAPVIEIPPGVDDRGRQPARRPRSDAPPGRAWACRPMGPLVVSISRLVPRKGMDVLIEAANRLAPSYPDLVVAIGGDGRGAGRGCERLAAASGPAVRLLGRVSDEDRTALLGAADVFVMACRNRWAGLSRRGSASSSWKRPRRACRRSPGTAAARPRRWSTG